MGPVLYGAASASYGGCMRAQGLVREPADTRTADHVCWAYDDPAGFGGVAGAYLAEGLAGGERLLCVGDDVVERLRRDPGRLGDVDDLVARGALGFMPLAAAYGPDGRFVPERQLAFYEGATRQAIDDGYRGLRVVAEISALAADPDRRPDLVRWEHLADDYIASGSGMKAMCAYRSDLVGIGPVTEVTSVHPLVHGPDGVPSFRLFFDDGVLALAGAVEFFSADRLRGILAASHVRGPVVVLDLTALEFIGVAGYRALAEWGAQLDRRSAHLQLRGTSPLFRRTWQLLGFPDVTDVSFEAAPS